MDSLKTIQSEAETYLTENECDRISINKILEVIEQAYSLGLLHGTQNVFEDYD